jgi:hypothetical protein
MTAQVIFLNQFYYPTEIERARLDQIQERMELYQAELDYLTRDFSPFNRYIFKQSSYNNIRQTWVLILGGNDQDLDHA